MAGSLARSTTARVQDVHEDEALTIYTDGSMFGSPRRGGIGLRFAWIDEDGDEKTHDETLPATMNATNNEMELEAPSEALELVLRGRLPVDLGSVRKIVIRTDSAYVQGNVKKAMFVWSGNKWTKQSGAAVLNARAWKRLITLMRRVQNELGKRVEFEQIKGKKGRHAVAADKLAKQSANSESFGRARPVSVRRKMTPEQVDSGSVKVTGQTLMVRIVEAQYLHPPHRRYRYKYEVMSLDSAFVGKVDWAESDLNLAAGHTYSVRMNADQANPRIDKLLEEIEEDLTAFVDTLRELAHPATAKKVTESLAEAAPGAHPMRVRARLEKLVSEGKARKVRSSGRGKPYAYEPVEVAKDDASPGKR